MPSAFPDFRVFAKRGIDDSEETGFPFIGCPIPIHRLCIAYRKRIRNKKGKRKRKSQRVSGRRRPGPGCAEIRREILAALAKARVSFARPAPHHEAELPPFPSALPKPHFGSEELWSAECGPRQLACPEARSARHTGVPDESRPAVAATHLCP